MRRMRGLKLAVMLGVLATMVAIPALEAVAVGGTEFGLAFPISTSFSFSSLSLGLEAYYRLAGALLAWDIALHTNMYFDSLYIRNTIAGVGALHLAIGALTNLLPYFGSTYVTLGLGLTLGHAIVFRAMFNIAASISAHGVFWFPEFRFQIGIDP